MWSAITNIIIILCYDLRSGEFSAVCKDKNLKNVMPKMHIIPQFRTTLKSREMLDTQTKCVWSEPIPGSKTNPVCYKMLF